ncbi:MAG: dTDP-4-dehydrorhamnose 3,5-epimerase family protein [Bryobacteraceae bacterium]
MQPAVTLDAVEIEIPQCEKGLGEVIGSPDQAGLIDGVRIQPSALHPDDRGWFLEVARLGRGLVSGFPKDTTQVSAALSYPGTIKAFHFHRKQTDFWVPAAGMLQVALVDMRPGSPTFGARNTMYTGELRPWQIVIPPGVGHGYKVIGTGPALLVYVTNRFYDRDDEGRIPYDDPRIAYDWEIQHK